METSINEPIGSFEQDHNKIINTDEYLWEQKTVLWNTKNQLQEISLSVWNNDVPMHRADENSETTLNLKLWAKFGTKNNIRYETTGQLMQYNNKHEWNNKNFWQPISDILSIWVKKKIYESNPIDPLQLSVSGGVWFDALQYENWDNNITANVQATIDEKSYLSGNHEKWVYIRGTADIVVPIWRKSGLKVRDVRGGVGVDFNNLNVEVMPFHDITISAPIGEKTRLSWSISNEKIEGSRLVAEEYGLNTKEIINKGTKINIGIKHTF